MISACLLAAALVFSQEDAKAAFDLTVEFVKANPRRDAGTYDGKVASRWLLGKASVVGGNVYQDSFQAMTPVGMRSFTNLYCPFERDSSAPWTVFVSHFDTKPGANCPGANDGGATSCLLVQLVKVIFDNRDFDRNVMFVWTDGEECKGPRYTEDDGFQGSKRAAEMLRQKKVVVDGVYVLDMLGDKDLKISIPPNVSMDLAKKTVAAAKRLGLKRNQFASLDTVVLDDHVPFKAAGFKTIDLIDFEYGSKPGLNDYWHTPKDTPDKLSADSFLTVGRLVCEILSGEEKKR